VGRCGGRSKENKKTKHNVLQKPPNLDVTHCALLKKCAHKKIEKTHFWKKEKVMMKLIYAEKKTVEHTQFTTKSILPHTTTHFRNYIVLKTQLTLYLF